MAEAINIQNQTHKPTSLYLDQLFYSGREFSIEWSTPDDYGYYARDICWHGCDIRTREWKLQGKIRFAVSKKPFAFSSYGTYTPTEGHIETYTRKH